jgi:hypothetical protein
MASLLLDHDLNPPLSIGIKGAFPAGRIGAASHPPQSDVAGLSSLGTLSVREARFWRLKRILFNRVSGSESAVRLDGERRAGEQ